MDAPMTAAISAMRTRPPATAHPPAFQASYSGRMQMAQGRYPAVRAVASSAKKTRCWA